MVKVVGRVVAPESRCRQPRWALLFLRPDGTTLGQTTAPPQPSAETVAAGAVWYVDTDGHLRTVAPDGARGDRGALPGDARPGDHDGARRRH